MVWLDRLLGGAPRAAAPAPAVPEYVPQALARSTKHKIGFHIRRFERAIAQCERPSRLTELGANLDYWRAVEAAELARGEWA